MAQPTSAWATQFNASENPVSENSEISDEDDFRFRMGWHFYSNNLSNSKSQFKKKNLNKLKFK